MSEAVFRVLRAEKMKLVCKKAIIERPNGARIRIELVNARRGEVTLEIARTSATIKIERELALQTDSDIGEKKDARPLWAVACMKRWETPAKAKLVASLCHFYW